MSDRVDAVGAVPAEIELEIGAPAESKPAKPKRKRARRGANEGSVYKRADGRWVGAAVVGRTAAGRPRKRVVYAPTQHEVVDKLAQLKADAKDGKLVEPNKITLDGWLTSWADSVKVRTRTRDEYRRVCSHVRRHLGAIPLSQLDKRHVTELHAAWEREGLGARTRQAAHRALGAALDAAIEADLVARNVAKRVRTPRAQHSERECYSPEQLRQLVEAAEADEVAGPLVVLLASSGLRLGEALGLAWKHLDLGRGTVKVERVLSETTKRVLSFERPKTERSRRVVTLPERCVAALQRHRDRIEGEPDPAGLVFTDRGRPWRRSRLTRAGWRPLLKRAGLPRLGIHAVRHSHASALLQAGVPVPTVSARLGHSNASITLSVYSHVFEADGRVAADRVQALLG